MRYSIVMPVLNREKLTRNCLATLRPTLAGAGDGEIIVRENGLRKVTAGVLPDFPRVRLIRNYEKPQLYDSCICGGMLRDWTLRRPRPQR